MYNIDSMTYQRHQHIQNEERKLYTNASTLSLASK
jgi:hypothetical protein